MYSRCWVVSENVNQYAGNGFLVVLRRLVIISLLQLGQPNHSLHPDCSLLVTHSLEKRILELLV